jgi:SAM-dependent methyltransferase
MATGPILGRRHRGLAGQAACPWPDDVFLRPGPGDHFLEASSGEILPVDPLRWHGPADDADIDLLARVVGRVLDIGCGPGRMALSLIRSGTVALGIDTSAAAVGTTRRRGALAIQTSVFGPVPWAGSWGTALLADGNVGIGGDPVTLLRRTGQLLLPGGRVLVELAPPGTPTRQIDVRIGSGSERGPWFPWAQVAITDLPALAGAAGLQAQTHWCHSGRWFAQLAARPAKPGFTQGLPRFLSA